MTTTASGRCTSEPGPVANTIGTRLKIAMLAVISTAGASFRSRAAPLATPLALGPKLGDVRHQHQAVQDGDPKSTMKPTEAGTER